MTNRLSCGSDVFLLLLYLDDHETVAQILSSSVLDSVNTTPAVWHLLSTAVLFTLFWLPCSYLFLLGIKEKVGRREKFNFPSLWPHPSISQPESAPWYHERVLLNHNYFFTAVRLLIQICKHVDVFQWSVSNGSAKEWLKNSTGGGGRVIYLIISVSNLLPSNLLPNDKVISTRYMSLL